jgi:enoyl-CoA hydratase/carnithine racemase
VNDAHGPDGSSNDNTDARAEVLYDVVDHVATLTLNAPERMNTISGVMLTQISELLLRADRDPDVRCIVLTGSGRAFCAGLDLQAQMAGTEGWSRQPGRQRREFHR